MCENDTLEVIIGLGKKIDPNIWDGFNAVSLKDILRIEKEINRELSEDFKHFYSKIGYGYFPDTIGGGIDSPSEIINNCHAPYYFITGSMTPRVKWASNDEQRKFYISYGKENPNPNMFNTDSMFLEGTFLLDLVQIGSNGCCCYHQLNIGKNSEFKYCLLTDSGEIEDKSLSFYEGILSYLKRIMEENQ